MESTTPFAALAPRVDARGALLLTIAVTLIGTCLPSLAKASNGLSDCDRLDRDMNRIDVRAPASDLSARIVDLESTPDRSADEDMDAEDGIDPGAPLLFLGPRVNTLVRDAFTSTDPDDAPVPGKSALPPLADRADSPVADESDLADDEEYRSQLPSLQRRMYRTDI